MINITQFNQAIAALKTANSAIADYVLCAHEAHLVNKLKDKRGIILAAIYPSTERKGANDAIISENTTWLFVLEKMNNSATNADEVAQYQRLHEVVQSLFKFIEDDGAGCSLFFERYQVGSTIMPEYNEFGGFNGWSFSVNF